jgi:hypothetical protein
MFRNQHSLFSATTITALAAGLVMASAACDGKQEYQTQMDAEMQYMDHTMAHYGSHMRDMSDNAILSDMSVADIHFVPHTSELSGIGVARLDRMAAMLNTYGGTVRYETDLRDEDLMQKRINNVREYLAVAGCNMDRVEVKAMISGGRGMAADKAMIVEAKGTAKPSSTGAAQAGASSALDGPRN